jgi:hypothetical protein
VFDGGGNGGSNNSQLPFIHHLLCAKSCAKHIIYIIAVITFNGNEGGAPVCYS